jgi:ankyrin repeat protein
MNSIDRDLVVVVRENNLPEVSRLLRAGADVNAKDWLQRTLLIVASALGHVQVVKELLDHGADVEAKDSSLCTPLHWASNNGCVAVVNELLSRGANIEAKTLHLASLLRHLPVVKVLVAAGAEILATNNYGKLPIHKAVSGGKAEVAKCLLQHFYATTLRLPLHDLLEEITWTDDPNSSSAPPLHDALHQNVLDMDDVVEIIEYLVSRNPALLSSSRDQDGLLPLHVACRRGAPFPIVQSLVDLYKPSVKSMTSEGDLPLFLACEMREPSLDTIFHLMKLYPDLVNR